MGSRTRAAAPGVALLVSLVAACLLPLPVTAHEPGDLDRSFSRDGFKFVEYGDAAAARSVFVRDDGRLLVAGLTTDTTTGNNRLLLAQITADGRLDRRFGADGFVVRDPLESSTYNEPLAWQRNTSGDLVALGVCCNGTGYYLMRLKPGGRRDRTFGDRGLLLRPKGGWPMDVLVLPDGRTLVLTEHHLSGYAIRAHRANGSKDRRFGNDGLTVFGDGTYDDLAYDPSGRVLAAGRADVADQLFVRAFHPDGSVDRTFGERGRAASRQFRSGRDRYVLLADVTVLANGDILLVAEKASGWDASTTLVRFNSDGSIDDAFGGDGVRGLGMPGTDLPVAAVELSDRRLVVLGNVDHDLRNEATNLFVALVTAEGRFDQSFAQDGVFQSNFGFPGSRVTAFDVIELDGRLVVAGTLENGDTGTGRAVVFRLLL